MPSLKISELPLATLVNDADLIPIVQGGVNKKATRNLVTASGIYYSGNYTDLDAAITAIGSTAGTLIIHSAIPSVGNVTVPTTLAVVFTGGGMLTVPNATTTTFNGPFEAPLKTVFTLTGTGLVAFGRRVLDYFRPEWWGAKGNADSDGLNGTECSTALQKCFDAAKATQDLTPDLEMSVVKLIPGGRYMTLPVTCGSGVCLDMEGATLTQAAQAGGFTHASTLLTVSAAVPSSFHRGLSAAGLWYGGAGHGFSSTYWETNIGIFISGPSDSRITFGTVGGFCIGVRIGGGTIVAYNSFSGGFFHSNKITFDLRTTSSNFVNENNFHDCNISLSSNITPFGTVAGIRFSSDDNGEHGQNNNRFDGFCFQVGDHSATYDWVSGTSKTSGNCYAAGTAPYEKYWQFKSATANCGTNAPPAFDNVTFTNATELVTFASLAPVNDILVYISTSDGTGVAPTGLSLYTWYWVVNTSGSTCQLSLTKGGAAVTFTTDGSGSLQIEAQRYMTFTDNASKLWLCDGVKFHAPMFIDDTSFSQTTVTRCRWEGGYGPFTHIQGNRRFTTSGAGSLFEPYALGTTYYATAGDLNPSASIDVTKYQFGNIYRQYNNGAPKLFALDDLHHRYLRGVTNYSTIAGMAFLSTTAWDTIVQSIDTVTGFFPRLCKNHLQLGSGAGWMPVVFVDMVTHKAVAVSADLVAAAQFVVAKPFTDRFKNIAVSNYTKSLCGGSALQTADGGYLYLISPSTGASFGVPNVAGSTTRFIMVGLSNLAEVRGLTFSVPPGMGTGAVPLRVVTPWGLSSDMSRHSVGVPIRGYFLRAGEFIKNISTGANEPEGWIVKTEGALAPAWATATVMVFEELRVGDAGTRVYACQTAGTSGGGSEPTGTGTGISDGTLLWDYICPVAALEVVQKAAKAPTTGTLASATFAQHALTGAQEVINLNTAATPGTLTTRTATEMVAEQGGGVSGSWKVRIVNISGNMLTVGLGSGVTNPLSTTLTIAASSFGDFLFTATSATAVTIARVGTGTHV
jgi:hypothetical protein